MKLIVITGTCGAGKSTVIDKLRKVLASDCFAYIDTDELGINWWDYAETDHEEAFSEDCIKKAVRRAEGKDLIFSSCLNPLDYIERNNIPDEVDSTFFTVLCPSDEIIVERLRARPKERGFVTDEIIIPHVKYNQWFRKNKGKFQLWIDNSSQAIDDTVKEIATFIEHMIN